MAALIYAGFAESFGTHYPDDFNYLDSNADGKVTFDEITEVNWINLDNSTLKRFFDGADLNHNGYLKGHEFDFFGDDVVRYAEPSEDTSSSNDKYKYSSTSITAPKGLPAGYCPLIVKTKKDLHSFKNS